MCRVVFCPCHWFKKKKKAVCRKWQLCMWLPVYFMVLPVNLFTIRTCTLCILFHHTKANNVFDLHQNMNIHTISLSHVPSCDDVLFSMLHLMMMMSIFNLNIMFLSRSDELVAYGWLFFVSSTSTSCSCQGQLSEGIFHFHENMNIHTISLSHVLSHDDDVVKFYHYNKHYVY